MSTKKAEIDYPNKLSSDEYQWLYEKPFGKLSESPRRIRDFSHIIYILNAKKGAKILDLGVGSGWTSIFLSKMGYEVTGVDISEPMIKIAKKKALEEKTDTKFIVYDIENYLIDEKFDFIISYDALHHCPDEIKVLTNCYKMLKKGGKLLLAEPNWYQLIDKNAQKIAKKYGTLEKGYSPYYLKKTLKKIGFSKTRQYFANDMLTKPYDGGLKDTVIQILAPLLQRLVFSHFKSQVWILSEK